MTNHELDLYQEQLKKNPKSRVFSFVADGLRERGFLSQAFEVAKMGIKEHPEYARGWLSLGRIHYEKGEWEEAIRCFSRATQLAPDNVLAFQWLGDAYVVAKNLQGALRAYKLGLLLDPTNTKLETKVKKIEELENQSYDEQFFELKPLRTQKKSETEPASSPTSNSEATSNELTSAWYFERQISFIDALLARGDGEKAKKRLEELSELYPAHPEILRRWELFLPPPPPPQIKPKPQRERYVLEKKRKKLEAILNVIGQIQRGERVI